MGNKKETEWKNASGLLTCCSCFADCTCKDNLVDDSDEAIEFMIKNGLMKSTQKVGLLVGFIEGQKTEKERILDIIRDKILVIEEHVKDIENTPAHQVNIIRHNSVIEELKKLIKIID